MIQLVSEYSNYLKELPKLIKESPYKPAYIIEKLQISKATYYRKLKDNSFSVEEVEKLTKILFPKEIYLKETLANSRDEIHIGKFSEYEKLMEKITNVVS